MGSPLDPRGLGPPSRARRRRLAQLARLCLLVSFAVGGCRRPPNRPSAPVLDELQVRLRRTVPASLAVPTPDELSALVRAAVAAVPGPLRYEPQAPAQAPRGRLSVTIELLWQAPPPGGQGSLVAQLSVKLEPKGEAPLSSIVREAQVEKEGLSQSPSAGEVRAHVARALELTVGAAMRAEQLWLGPGVGARDAVLGKDEDLRDDAIRFCAERKDREAVPALLELLKRDDVELRDRAIGALAEIGDARAVRPLGELAKFGDLGELPKIIDAISRVGGEEAAAYLEFVAGGHPNAEMRAVAKRALEHLRQRAAPPP